MCRIWLVLLPCSWHILFVSPPVSAIHVCFWSGSSRRITVESGSPALGCSSSVLLLHPGFKPVFVSGSQSMTMSSSCPIQPSQFFHGYAPTGWVLPDVWCYEAALTLMGIRH
ncbi:unnamed protein product [Brassica oleracea]|uniref:(rape) hypothetical protein n=1 Tax=Brassica napus TaxID=3708 RepID=A0A816Q0Y5_BRANA|nr:unnamed protein product [Brassica napus]